VKDPWATLCEAVYRADIPEKRSQEALSYLNQAEEYFIAGTRSESVISVKPVLLYYSVLNLAKCMLAVGLPALDLSLAQHGLSATHTGVRATLGDEIKVKTSATRVNIFGEAMKLLNGQSPKFKSLMVRHLLAQIVPAHRLWTYASQKRERFISVEITATHNQDDGHAWLVLALDRGELAYLGKTVKDLIASSELPETWEQVDSKDPDIVLIEQQKGADYSHRPLDCIQDLFAALRPALWSVVTSDYPHRKYYLNFDSSLGPRRLPQWASMYVLFFYLSDLTRYRPVHFDRFLESKYGPQIESILDECPRQFLYLAASELLKREVAPAALA